MQSFLIAPYLSLTQAEMPKIVFLIVLWILFLFLIASRIVYMERRYLKSKNRTSPQDQTREDDDGGPTV